MEGNESKTNTQKRDVADNDPIYKRVADLKDEWIETL